MANRAAAPTTTPWLSLVVLSYKRFDATTGPCLETLFDADADPRIEIVLVDNGSDDGAAQRCAELATARPRIRYAPQTSNLGFAGGMNAGVALARGEWVCLVNSDTLFPSGALAALCRALVSVAPEVAMVGPVTNAAGNGQRLPLPNVPMAAIAAIAAVETAQPTGLLIPTYRSDFFCVAVRRVAWQEIGGLDLVFGLGYYEDFDFSLRLRRAGWQQVIAEDVFVAHVGSASFSGLGTQQHALMRRNRLLMKQRHTNVHFDPARLGNAQALRALVEHAEAEGWTDALKRRAAWRLAALLWDEPKSPFKRWRWRWSQRDLRRRLAAAAVQPRFPTVA